MREEKNFIINEYGEVVRVTKEEYKRGKEENKDEKKNISGQQKFIIKFSRRENEKKKRKSRK